MDLLTLLDPYSLVPFEFQVVYNLIAKAEPYKHHLPQQCLGNLFAKVI